MDLATALRKGWVPMAGFLVFLTRAGFGVAEAGFARVKNVCKVAMKCCPGRWPERTVFCLVGYASGFGNLTSLNRKEMTR